MNRSRNRTGNRSSGSRARTQRSPSRNYKITDLTRDTKDSINKSIQRGRDRVRGTYERGKQRTEEYIKRRPRHAMVTAAIVGATAAILGAAAARSMRRRFTNNRSREGAGQSAPAS